MLYACFTVPSEERRQTQFLLVKLLHFAFAVNQQYLCAFTHDLVGETELVHQLDEMLPADKTRAVRVVDEQ